MASVQFSDTASILSFESASSATSTTGLLPMGSASNAPSKAPAGTDKNKIPGHRRFRTISTAFLTKNNLAEVSTLDLPGTNKAASEDTNTTSQKRKRGLSFARKAETAAHKKASGASGAPSESTSTSYMAVLEAAWNRKRKMKHRASLPDFKPAQPVTVDRRAELLESGLDEVTLEAIGIRLDGAEKENRA